MGRSRKRTKDAAADGSEGDGDLASGRKRTKSKPRAKPDIIPDAELDAIKKRDVSRIPSLKIRNRNNGFPYVHVGTDRSLERQGLDGAIYMMPFAVSVESSSSSQTRLNFWNFADENKSTPISGSAIDWTHPMLDYGLLESAAGRSRWSRKPDRVAKHREWLHFIWQHTTQRGLPTNSIAKAKTTPVDQQRADSVLEETPFQSKKGEKPPQAMRKLARRKDVDSEEEVDGEWARKVILEWDKGVSEPTDYATLYNIQKAWGFVRPSMPLPPLRVIKEAYEEHHRRGTLRSAVTETWLQYEQDATGDKRKVRLDLSDYKRHADHMLEAVKYPDRARLWRGPPLKEYHGPQPTVDEALGTINAWKQRGASSWDEEIEAIACASKVIMREIVRQSRCVKSSDGGTSNGP